MIMRIWKKYRSWVILTLLAFYILPGLWFTRLDFHTDCQVEKVDQIDRCNNWADGMVCTRSEELFNVSTSCGKFDSSSNLDIGGVYDLVVQGGSRVVKETPL